MAALIVASKRGEKQRKIRSNSSVSGCLSCFWVGFPPAPRFQLLAPTKLTDSPLSTTLYHILAVSRLLSSRNLQVNAPLMHRFRKARSLVVYQFEHHNHLCLRLGSFAILSLRFFLISARDAEFPVEICRFTPSDDLPPCCWNTSETNILLTEGAKP